MASQKTSGLWQEPALDARRRRSHRHNRAPLTKFERATARFAHVHVDLVGPLPASKGHTHLLTVIDRFTRWPEAIPLAQTDTASIGRAFALHWVARFGVPSDITSDRGAQFTSDMWKALAESLGSKIHHTTAYHPQSNGLVERFHRSLKAALRARLTTPSWLDELPWVMLGLRTMPKEDLGTSVAEMVYGSTLTVPGTFVGPSSNSDAAEHLQNMREHGRTTCASTGCMAWNEGHSHYKRFRRSRVRFCETRCFAQSAANAVHGSIIKSYRNRVSTSSYSAEREKRALALTD